jgi:hypothetical protein
MEKKTSGIIAVVVAALLCGVPGLAGLCIGPLAIFGSLLPESELASSEGSVVIISGIAMICVSLVFIGIPIVIGILTFGEQKQELTGIEELIPEEDF